MYKISIDNLTNAYVKSFFKESDECRTNIYVFT